jgi:PhnB protein
MVGSIPEGYQAVIPHLILSDGDRAIRFYRRAFGATEIYRLTGRNGRIAHAELQIRDCRIMVSEEMDELPAWAAKSARSYGGSPVVLVVYTHEVDTIARRFLNAGGIVVSPLQNHFYGDRSGQFRDPEGYIWTLAERIEQVAPEEMERRMAKMR